MSNYYFPTLLLLLVFSVSSLHSQTTAGFEDVGVPVDSFYNGSDAAGGFSSGAIFLPNEYTPEFDSWTGWALSTQTDTTTRGFTNQYSAITGSGYAGSLTYAVNFGSAFAPATIRLTGAARGGLVTELYLTNSTYTYYSMLEGDSFTKRFGGETGDDPDFLRLTFRKYLDGILSTDSLDFYLADYRFTDNSQDYLIDEWTRLDLSELGPADSLQVIMTGTDVGQFGLNTPSYFCMDAVTTLDATVAVAEADQALPLVAYPNPTDRWVYLLAGDLSGVETILLFDIHGRLVRRFTTAPTLDLSGIESGTYALQIVDKQRTTTIKLVKS